MALIEEEKLQKMKAKESLKLAKQYLDIAQFRGKEEKYLRGVIDSAYNAAELCVKGLLAFKIRPLPSTHGGLVLKFGEFYIKDGPLRKEFGRLLNKSLRWRNIARYEPDEKITKREITKENAKLVIKLTKELMRVLEKKIK